MRSTQSSEEPRKIDRQLLTKAVGVRRVLGATGQKGDTCLRSRGQGGRPRGSSPRALCFAVRLERLYFAWEKVCMSGAKKSKRCGPGEGEQRVSLLCRHYGRKGGGLARLPSALLGHRHKSRSGIRGTFA